MTTPIARHPTRIFPQVIVELADKYGDAPALLSDRESFSYRELAARSNRYARWALTQGIRKGDTICLMMPNRPEFLALWLGVTHIGGVVALLNTNLTGMALAYCINVVKPLHIVVATEMFEALETARRPPHRRRQDLAARQSGANYPRIDQEVDALPGDDLTDVGALRAHHRGPRALHLHVGHDRPAQGRQRQPLPADAGEPRLRGRDGHSGDRPHVRLPADVPHRGRRAWRPAPCWSGAAAVVLRERFSAREFWDDVVRWDCTLFQYIGELCRYLVNCAAQSEGAHAPLRLACGNGLRPEIWPEFKRRFQIPKIIEFYAATEGNVSLFNFEDKEGAVGRLPWWIALRFPTRSCGSTWRRQQPVRNDRGLLHRVRPGRSRAR